MRIALVATLLAIAAAPARADRVAGPAGSDFTVDVPKGWTSQAAQQGSEAILISVSPKQDAGLVFAAVEAKNFDNAVKLIDEILGAVVTDPKVTKGGAVTINGMQGLALGGTATAKDDGKPVTLGAVIVQTNATHVGIAIGMVHTAVKAEYKAALEAGLSGLKRK
jgi:hypothetical protein